jgi:hypothetical protein
MDSPKKVSPNVSKDSKFVKIRDIYFNKSSIMYFIPKKKDYGHYIEIHMIGQRYPDEYVLSETEYHDILESILN